MKLLKLSRTIWLLIGALLVIIGLWVGVIMPGLERAKTKTQHILDMQNSLDSNATTISNFINAKQAQPDLEQARTELAGIFINPANPVSFISRLEELAASRNVAFDISVSDPVLGGNPTLSQRPVRITTTGPLDRTLNFINDIAEEPFALTVNKTTIEATDGETGTVTITVDALTYWRL